MKSGTKYSTLKIYTVYAANGVYHATLFVNYARNYAQTAELHFIKTVALSTPAHAIPMVFP